MNRTNFDAFFIHGLNRQEYCSYLYSEYFCDEFTRTQLTIIIPLFTCCIYFLCYNLKLLQSEKIFLQTI